MHFFATKGKTRMLFNFVLLLYIGHFVGAENTIYTVEDRKSETGPEVVLLEHQRTRRQAPALPVPPPAPALPVPPPAPAPPVPPAAPTTLAPPTGAPNTTAGDNDKNQTTKQTVTEAKTTPVAVVTSIPLLGVNGSGIFRGNSSNNHLVSDPILPALPDDDIAQIFDQETPEMIKAQQNISDLKYDHHTFYNSSFIGNRTFFEEYWKNITAPPQTVHSMLSNSYRRAVTMEMSFEFPYYGTILNKITVATGGFIYTGSQLHNWLAATQYIAPFMANFETKGRNDSVIKFMDDGEKFTTLWENVHLREEPTARFTFAATLYKSGDIVFAYKNISKPVQQIADNEHPVKVGISDAYHTDRVMFLIRRKTIFEYHRVSFKDHHDISNGTIIWLMALPTCLKYNNCFDCLNHNTGFNCTWCDQIQRCSSGTDRNKQEWLLRNCNRTSIVTATECAADNRTRNGTDAGAGPDTTVPGTPHLGVNGSGIYMGNSSNNHMVSDPIMPSLPDGGAAKQSLLNDAPAQGSSAGGVVAALLVLTALSLAAGWAVYAYKNPHSLSGQMFIKYRPSTWSWKRGEARYTAATIHM